MNKNNHRATRKITGIVMLEIVFAIVILGLLGLWALNKFVQARENTLIRQEYENITRYIASTQDKYFNAIDSTGVTTDVLRNNNVFDISMINGTTVNNRARGTVTCVANTANDGVACTNTNYSRQFCTEIVPKIETIVSSISVNSTTVKAAGGALNMGTLGTSCGAAPNTVVFVFNKS